jgi:hypothetical protein
VLLATVHSLLPKPGCHSDLLRKDREKEEKSYSSHKLGKNLRRKEKTNAKEGKRRLGADSSLNPSYLEASRV